MFDECDEIISIKCDNKVQQNQMIAGKLKKRTFSARKNVEVSGASFFIEIIMIK